MKEYYWSYLVFLKIDKQSYQASFPYFYPPAADHPKPTQTLSQKTIYALPLPGYKNQRQHSNSNIIKMNNHFVQNEKTSVRVHQTPGGNSSLNLGWDQKCDAVKNRKIDRNQSSIVFSDGSNEPLMEKRNNYQAVQPGEVPMKVTQQVGGNTTIALGEGPTAPKTSVKVRAPPGGKSNIIFG